MRRIALLGPVVGAAILLACESSGSSSGAADVPEGGVFEAGPSSDGPEPDSSRADAADATVAAATSVVVDVTRAGAPAANVTIVFHDAAGNVLETKTTGIDGTATSTPGVTPSQVTALLGGGGLRRLLTWTAVELGDRLFAEDVGPAASSGSFAVTLQGDFSDGGAVRAAARIGSCAGNASGTIATIALDPDCARPAASILATAFDQFDAPIAYAYAKSKAAPVDGGIASATVGSWLVPSTVTITTSNAPLQSSLSAGLLEISGGLGFDNASGTGLTAGAEKFVAAPGFADAYQAGVRITPNLVVGSKLLVAKRVAPAATTDLDLSTALPSLDSATIDASVATRPLVAWTTAGGASLAATDGGSIAIRWTDARTDDRGWAFVVAPGATSVKAPVMPAAADAWLPQGALDGGAASSFDAPEVTFVESDLLAGYTALRRDVGRIIPLRPTSERYSFALLPANGTLRATSFFAPVL